MRFQITATLLAAATMLTGVVADDSTQTSQATVTLTRTVQRVAATVTATKCSSTTLATAVPSGGFSGYTNGTVVSPSLSSTAPARQTGAAGALRVEMIGLAAAAGLAGYLI